MLNHDERLTKLETCFDFVRTQLTDLSCSVSIMKNDITEIKQSLFASDKLAAYKRSSFGVVFNIFSKVIIPVICFIIGLYFRA